LRPVCFGTSIADAEVVCVSNEFINQQLVNDIHRHGMLVYVYTVNDQDDIDNVLAYGVDGIITDYP
jgi:glycerophosphoryl diester phosphodiesterase